MAKLVSECNLDLSPFHTVLSVVVEFQLLHSQCDWHIQQVDYSNHLELFFLGMMWWRPDHIHLLLLAVEHHRVL